MDELSTIKKELKCWEHMFQRKHGRKPSKEDVNNGPEEIKETYQRYKELKFIASHKQKENKDEDDGVFGKDLNKKSKSQISPLHSVKIRDWSGAKPIKLCHGQRPRIRIDWNSDDFKVASCVKEMIQTPNYVHVDVEAEDEAPNKKEFKITDAKNSSQTRDALTFRTPQLRKCSEMTSRIKRRASISSAWLDKYKPDVPSLVPSEGKEPGVAENSPPKNVDGTYNQFRCSEGGEIMLPQTTRQKIPPSLSDEKNTSNPNWSPSDEDTNICLTKEPSSQNLSQDTIPNHQGRSSGEKSCNISKSETMKEAKSLSQPSMNGKKYSASPTRNENVFDSLRESREGCDTNNEQQSMCVYSRAEFKDMECRIMRDFSNTDRAPCEIDNIKSMLLRKNSEAVTSEEDVCSSTTSDVRSWEGIISSNTRKLTGLLPEGTAKIKFRRKRDNVGMDGVEKELHPNKKLRKTETRDTSDIYEEEQLDRDFEQQKHEGGVTKQDDNIPDKKTKSKITDKMSQGNKRSVSGSGLVSENFKRLNMKVKSYRRRGGGVSGAAHKRRVWRQTERARGGFVQSSGWCRPNKGSGSKQGSCFKCGQEGHWAKNCRKQGKPVQKTPCLDKQSDEENEEWEQFPTFQEAACMAAGIPVSAKPAVDAEWNGSVLERDCDVVLPHQLPRPVHVPMAPSPAAEPFYQSHDGKPVDTPQEVLQTLKSFGYSNFRPGQEQAVMRILCGLSSLIVLSTGAGKSLCYQLPAYMYAKRSPSITLVISPLVSLMEDQIMGLPMGLKGACLHTNLTKTQREKVLADLCAGKVAVLLMSPEALVGGGTGFGCLPARVRLPPIAFACIDESHCLSEWSHNFRPSYLRVCKVLRERYGVQCFLGLTATATEATAASVAKHLGIPVNDSAIIRGAAIPSNLYLSVSCDRDRDMALIELLKGPRFSKCESVIIYCTRRQQTERVASMLRTCLQNFAVPEAPQTSEDPANTPKKKGRKTKRTKKRTTTSAPPKWDAESYHAGMTAAQRRRVQKRFMAGELRIVVATVAFGMGLDKSDVRAIIHYNMPKSFESYVQEIGRAGRDGLPSQCHVFLQPEGKDMYELRRHIYGNTVDRSTIKKLVKKFFPRCQCHAHHEKQLKREGLASLCDVGIPIDDCLGNEDPANWEDGKSVDNELRGETPLLNDEDGKMELNSSSETNDQPKIIQSIGGKRICGGHEVAVPIERLVQELDMPEENIATLLCYLELHDNRWLEVLQLIKSTCTIKCYGGYSQLRALAKKIPPIAAAFAYNEENSLNKVKKTNSISFPVVEIIDRMGWDLDPVCKELRSLQWNSSLAPDPAMASKGQSGILVEFEDISFLVRASGDLSDGERDQICDFLEDRILAEERTQITQLNSLYYLLKSVSCSEYWMCSEEADKSSDEQLKQIIQKYFSESNDATRKEMEDLSTARTNGKSVLPVESAESYFDFSSVARDIRNLTNVHHDHSFTGRSVARIFHGIDSPCYPAQVWGRDRRFWRKYLEIDFNSLRKFATRELLNLR